MNSSFFPVEHLPGVHVAEKHPDKRLGSWERHAGNENRKRGWSVRRWRMEGICTNLPGYARASKDKKGRNGIALEKKIPPTISSLVARFFFEWKWRMRKEGMKRMRREVSFDFETRFCCDSQDDRVVCTRLFVETNIYVNYTLWLIR